MTLQPVCVTCIVWLMCHTCCGLQCGLLSITRISRQLSYAALRHVCCNVFALRHVCCNVFALRHVCCNMLRCAVFVALCCAATAAAAPASCLIHSLQACCKERNRHANHHLLLQHTCMQGHTRPAMLVKGSSHVMQCCVMSQQVTCCH